MEVDCTETVAARCQEAAALDLQRFAFWDIDTRIISIKSLYVVKTVAKKRSVACTVNSCSRMPLRAVNGDFFEDNCCAVSDGDLDV